MFSSALVLHFGCSKESPKSDTAPVGPGPNPDASEEVNTEGQNCFSGKIQEILKDGRTVLLRSFENKEILFYWDLITNRIRKKIDFAFDYYQMNRDGNYFVRSFDNVRFQILSMNNDRTQYRESLLFTRGSKPDLNFSVDGKSLAVRFRKNSQWVNKVVVYNIATRDMIWNAIFPRTESVKMKDAENVAIVSRENGKRFLNIVNAQTNSFRFSLPLERGELIQMEIANSVVIVNIENIVYAYDLNTGRLRYTLPVRKVISVDADEDYALMETSYRKFEIINIWTGEVISKIPLTDNLVRTSCKINIESGSLYCVDSSKQSGLKRVDIYSGKETNLCYTP